MNLQGCAGRLGDAQDRPRADGVPRDKPRADTGMHPAACFEVPIRAEEGKIGADEGQSVRDEGEKKEEQITRKAMETLARFYEEDMERKTHICTKNAMNCKKHFTIGAFVLKYLHFVRLLS